jgi:phage tail-like protein
MTSTGDRVDPYGNFNFEVEIDGIIRAHFQECSGFDSSIEVIEHGEGGRNNTVKKLPGQTKFSNITLKWGLTDDKELYLWHLKWARGESNERKNLSIIVYDRNREEQVRWNVVQAWPAKWDGPDLNAEGNDVAIETLEIAHEGLERVQ